MIKCVTSHTNQSEIEITSWLYYGYRFMRWRNLHVPTHKKADLEFVSITKWSIYCPTHYICSYTLQVHIHTYVSRESGKPHNLHTQLVQTTNPSPLLCGHTSQSQAKREGLAEIYYANHEYLSHGVICFRCYHSWSIEDITSLKRIAEYTEWVSHDLHGVMNPLLKFSEKQS